MGMGHLCLGAGEGFSDGLPNPTTMRPAGVLCFPAEANGGVSNGRTLRAKLSSDNIFPAQRRSDGIRSGSSRPVAKHRKQDSTPESMLRPHASRQVRTQQRVNTSTGNATTSRRTFQGGLSLETEDTTEAVNRQNSASHSGVGPTLQAILD